MIRCHAPLRGWVLRPHPPYPHQPQPMEGKRDMASQPLLHRAGSGNRPCRAISLAAHPGWENSIPYTLRIAAVARTAAQIIGNA